MRELVLALGDFFFRRRSYLPLVLVPVLLAAMMGFQHPFQSFDEDLIWEAGAVLVALVGLAGRVWIVGVTPRGTSGRNTRHQKATVLNTTGPYSIVRHPLYVANGIIALGFALFNHTWLAPPVVMAATIAYYACIIRREEAFLRERFGSAFDAWATRTPAMLPRSWHYVPSERAFDERKALRGEFYAFALVLTMPLVLDMTEDLLTESQVTPDGIWVVMAVLGMVTFFALRFLKKHSTVLSAR
jgi:protein-S-isoprenylcysteine O-methyltransferase Ste14